VRQRGRRGEGGIVFWKRDTVLGGEREKEVRGEGALEVEVEFCLWEGEEEGVVR
jgi:hypothetical protein